MKKLIIIIIFFIIFPNLIFCTISMDILSTWHANESYDYQSSAATADFDNDGYLDLVVGSRYYLHIYKNINGTFEKTASWQSSSGYGPGYQSCLCGDAISVGDLDKNDFIDIAVAKHDVSNPEPPSVFYNYNGNFSSTPDWQATDNGGTNSCSVLANIDAAGGTRYLDLFVGGGASISLRKFSRVYLNNAGSLSTVASWTGAYGISLTAVFGKVDTDVYPELIVGDYNGFVRVYENITGTLQTTTCCSLYIGSPVTSLALGDWNNDNYLDLAVGYENGVRIYTNAKTATPAFSSTIALSIAGTYRKKVAWGDVDRDGDLDLAVGGEESTAVIRVYTNTGTGLSTTVAWQSSENETFKKILWADLDNDRDLELIAAANTSGLSRVYKNNSLTFGEINSWSSSEVNNNYGTGGSVILDDIDNDNDADLVIGNYRSGALYPSRVYKSIGTNLISTASWEAGILTNTRGIALGDINNDGDLDLAVAVAGSSKYLLFTNNGTNFSPLPSWSSLNFYAGEQCAWADIDGDGYQDLMAIDSSRVRMFKNNSGILDNTDTWNTSLTWGKDIAVMDIDNDTDLDIVAGSDSVSGNNIRVYRNINGSLETSASWSAYEPRANSLAVADIDQDGWVDLATGLTGNPIKLHKNLNGILEYTPSWSSSYGEDNNDIAFGDIDGDGFFDLAVTGGGGLAKLRIYKNVNGQLEEYPSWNASEDQSRSVAFGDVDRDGDLDIVLGRGTAARQTVLYKNSYIQPIRNLPNNPPWISKVSNVYLGNNRIQFFYYTHDPEYDSCRIKVQYSLMGQSQWKDCTIINPRYPLNDQYCLGATGYLQWFTWDLDADHITTPYVYIKIIVYPNFGKSSSTYSRGSSGPIMYSGYAYQKLVHIPIDGRPYAQIVHPLPDNIFNQGQSIPIIGAAYDQNFDHLTIEYKSNSGGWNSLYNTTTPQTPYGQIYSWNTAAKSVGPYSIRLIAYDTIGQTATNTVNIRLVSVPANAPTVGQLYPPGNATEVALNTPIIVQFSDYMNETTMNSETIKVFDGSQYIDGSLDYNYFTKTVSFIPNAFLTPNTYYVVSISSNFQNIYGVPMTMNFSWTFRSDSEFSSIITQVSPAIGKTDVEADVNSATAKIQYNKNVPSGYQNYIYMIDFASGSKITTTREYHTNYTLARPNSVKSNNLYIVKVTNNATGVPATYDYYFITKDTLTPAVISNLPRNNQQISLSGDIRAKFNKRMNDTSFMTNTFYVICSNNGKKLSGTREYDIAQNMITFTPSPSSLTQGRTYIATLTTGVKDFGGLSLAKTTNWKFKTPVPLSNPITVYPSNNTTNSIIKSPLIYANYSTDIDAATLNSSSFYVKSYSGINLSGTLSLSNNRKIKFDIDGYLSLNTWYTGIITKALKATNNTYMTNIYKWKFRTLPPIGTNEITFTPQKQATNISLSQTIKVTFPTNLETGTVHSESFYAYYILGSATNTIPSEIYISQSTNAQIVPQVLMPQNTTIYVKLTPAVKTILGTSLQTNYIWSFKTLKPLPGSLTMYPVSSSSNINITTVIEATFATNLNSSTINDQSFFIRYGTNTLTGSRSYDDSQKKITFTPANYLNPQTIYTAFCTTNIKTTIGTTLSNNVKWWFKTVPPLSNPTNITPLTSSTNIPLVSMQVRAIFKTNIDSGSVNPSTFYILPQSGAILSGTYSVVDKTVQFTPSSALSQNTIYTAVITADLRSSIYTTLTNDYRWWFKTVAPLENPTNINPQANTTNISLSSLQIRAIFRTNIDSATVNLSTFYVKSATGLVVSGNYNVNNKTVQFVPDSTLSQNTYYTTIITTGLKSSLGNSLASDYKWKFKTLPPLQNPTNIFPSMGSTNIALVTNKMRAIFRTNIDSGTLNSATFQIKSASGTLIPGNYSASGKSILFTPSINLSHNTFYTSIITTSLKSSQGTSLTNQYRWYFRTLNHVPSTAIISINPSAGTTNAGVGISPTIKLTNIYPIDSSTVNAVNIIMSNLTSTAQVFGNISFSLAQNQITFDPPSDLDQGEWYKVIFTTNIKTVFGTTLSSNYSWSFKTTAPYAVDIINYSPTNGEINVALNSIINVTFITDIDANTLSPASFYIVDETGNYLGGSRTVVDFTNIKFTPAGGYLSQNTSYTVIVPSNQLKYVNGIYVVNDKKWWFRTMPPIGAPNQIYPAADQKNVGINISVYAVFGVSLDSSTCTKENFRVYKGDLPIEGNVSYIDAEKKIVFSPSLTLESEATYRVLLTKDVKTTSGVSMTADYQWQFTTGKVIGKSGGKVDSGDGVLELVLGKHALTEDQAITITRVTPAAPDTGNTLYKHLDLCYDLGPADYTFKKPITIKINYSSGTLTGIDENKLALFYSDGGTWTRIGGSINNSTKILTATITKMGRYAVLEDSTVYSGPLDVSKVECQPRVFSPLKFDNVSIGFELKTTAQFTIKIFNMSEKLIKVLGKDIPGNYGNNTILWDGKDENNRTVPDGMYMISIEVTSGGKTSRALKPLVLMKK